MGFDEILSYCQYFDKLTQSNTSLLRLNLIFSYNVYQTDMASLIK